MMLAGDGLHVTVLESGRICARRSPLTPEPPDRVPPANRTELLELIGCSPPPVRVAMVERRCWSCCC
jgi:hypothetical protein